MQPDTSTFTNAATRHQPTPNSTTCAEWPSESAAVFDPQLHSLYLCQFPIDMRLGFDGVLARVIHWFGSARPHCAYAFTNARGNRIKLHWVLDVTFREDECRVRTGHAPRNLSTIRKFALTLLRRDQQYPKRSLRSRRKTADRLTQYRESLLDLQARG